MNPAVPHPIGSSAQDDFLARLEDMMSVGQVVTRPEALGRKESVLSWAIKKALDPQGIMNPGKVLPAQ